MTLGATAEIFAFVVFSFIAIAGALGMTTTMSMFRSGIFLMASFIGVAGLFILLLADLLGLLQIMMYIGGMLVMILFMLLFSGDPGGAMMAKMELPILEKFFSRGLLPKENRAANDDEHEENHHDQDMDMGDMSMMTPIKSLAAWIGLVVGVVLVALLLLFPAWPVSDQTPDPDSARQVGSLLMGKYMLAFEGAGLLILLGIFGAVFISRPGKHPDSEKRGAPSAVDETPAPIENDEIWPHQPTKIDV